MDFEKSEEETLKRAKTFIEDNEEPTSPVLRGKSAMHASAVTFKPNMGRICFIAFAIGLGVFCTQAIQLQSYVLYYWAAIFDWANVTE